MNQFNDIQAGAAPFSLRYDAVNDTAQAVAAAPREQRISGRTARLSAAAERKPSRGVPLCQSYYPMPAVYQWSFSVQQKLASSWVVEGDYVGSHTIHQFQFVDDNAPALPQGALANVPLQNRRPYPQWGILGTWAPIGWARYNAGTLSVKNNQWHGLTLQSNLSWAKNIASSRIGTSDQGNINFRVPYIWSGPSAITPYWWFITALNYQTPKLAVIESAATRSERLGVHGHLYGRRPEVPKPSAART